MFGVTRVSISSDKLTLDEFGYYFYDIFFHHKTLQLFRFLFILNIQIFFLWAFVKEVNPQKRFRRMQFIECYFNCFRALFKTVCILCVGSYWIFRIDIRMLDDENNKKNVLNFPCKNSTKVCTCNAL